MEDVFFAASFDSASCLAFILAKSSRSFLTKYSSSFAFSRSSHLLATVHLLCVRSGYVKTVLNHLTVRATDFSAAWRLAAFLLCGLLRNAWPAPSYIWI